MKASVTKLDENVTMDELIKVVDDLNNDKEVNGIIVQLPLPKHLHEQTIIDRICDEKDVDGFGLLNKGKLLAGIDSLRPATPYGIMKLLAEYNISIEGKNALVIGRSNIVGKPIALMLLEKNATVTIAHSRTQNLKEVAKNADIIVVAVGKAKFLTADMVKDGAVIVDVGINRVDGVLYGDVDFENVCEKASYITPVPGGVGPLTIASLLENTVKAYIRQKNK
jgi:methylenetetrahydrofolate dehydrogenase (NADP+)/methenyltetrahydrofolate cyclohydrolase